MKLTLEVPDAISRAMRLPEDGQRERLMLELACMLYAQNLLSNGKAAQLAEMNRQQFGVELEKRNIPRHYDQQCLAEDLDYAGV